jgi:signal transduction histidine kinase
MTALSLRLRLTLVTAGLLCLALVAGAFALTLVVSGSRVNALDGIARDRAAALVRLVEDDRVPESLPVSEPGEVAQVLDAAGRVVASSPNASRTLPVLPADTLARLRAEGGADGVVQGTEDSPYDPRARVAVLPATQGAEPVTVVVTVPLREVEGVLRALRVSLVGVVPTLTLLLAAAIWLALGRALHPVDQLRRAAAQVAREGGPGALPVPRAADELGALARTLNEMLDRLEGAAARQRSFVADAAHELRSPISALRATVEAALAHPAAWSSAELAGDLEPEVLRMQTLVDDLLLLARVGAAPAVRERGDLGRIARDAAAGVRTDGVAVAVSGSGEAWVDAPAVGRVVRNLVGNAGRHARSRVVVTVADGRVSVEDDGAGVPVEDRERVFERFVRLDEAREREAGGSGLGLAIAREIARDHGGDVVLGESGLGGLRATLTLPVGPGE